jgi:predicted N-acetyltransferase YhbS
MRRVTMEITLRKEIESDYRNVEDVTREAFWNLYIPGCIEHYLVHVLRDHKDFLKELDYVALANNQIVGNIMYTKSGVLNEKEETVDTITFGPVSVLPEYQRKGIGSLLMRHTIQKAREQNAKAIIIYGNPKNYCRHGFKSSKDYNIATMEGKYPFSLLVLELEEGVFKDHSWKYKESDVYNLDVTKVEEFDKLFIHKEKEYRYTQEEFKISCRAYIE